MTEMPPAPASHPTRRALLDAGLSLAEYQSLSRLTIDQIVREAGVAKGTFYNHFPDRTGFLIALHRQFHEHLKALVLAAVENMPPGSARLQHAAHTYLDGCLAAKGVKALLIDARSEPAIATEVQHRNLDFAALAEADFAAMGWSNPGDSARLYVVMCAEAALMELDIGHAAESVRGALDQFIASRI